MTDSYYRAIVKSGVSAYGQRIARYVGDVLSEEVRVGVVVDHRALDGLEGRAEQVVVVVVAWRTQGKPRRSALRERPEIQRPSHQRSCRRRLSALVVKRY